MKFVGALILSVIMLSAGYAGGVVYPDLAEKAGLTNYLPFLTPNPVETPEVEVDSAKAQTPNGTPISELETNSDEAPDDAGDPVSLDEGPSALKAYREEVLRQGGFVRGLAPAEQEVAINDVVPARTLSGAYFYGIGRKETGPIQFSGAPSDLISLEVEARDYVSGQSINVPRSLGDGAPTGHDDLFPEISGSASRALGDAASQGEKARQASKKAVALQSRADLEGFLEDWILPIQHDWRETSSWGAERVINGVTKIHGGVDMAALTGTKLVAPASGVVTLAATDFYYEGGVVFIDHGLGITSIYLHMSEVSVSEGDVIEQGTLIGKVGDTGSATGSHLCWRLYAGGRDKPIDPMLLIKQAD